MKAGLADTLLDSEWLVDLVAVGYANGRKKRGPYRKNNFKREHYPVPGYKIGRQKQVSRREHGHGRTKQ